MIHDKVLSTLNGKGRDYFLSQSAYTLAEIESVLDTARKQEARARELFTRANVLLEGQGLIQGYDSDQHRALYALCNNFEDDRYPAYLGVGRHAREQFPLKTWIKRLASERRYLDELEKAIVELEQS